MLLASSFFDNFWLYMLLVGIAFAWMCEQAAKNSMVQKGVAHWIFGRLFK